jgi:hypothetical protein
LDFLNFAISDPAILHATLANVAKTLCTLSGVESSPALAYHLGQAITLVNQGITDSTHKATTKETIMAVTCLASLGVRTLSVGSISVYIFISSSALLAAAVNMRH